MNLAIQLAERSLGELSPPRFAKKQNSRFLHALQAASHVVFDGQRDRRSHPDDPEALPVGNTPNQQDQRKVAHRSGVNAIAIDKFEGRYLISGAANGNIATWDLENASNSVGDGRGQICHHPIGSVQKSAEERSYGITGISFYPFDSLAFFASSYDHSVKAYDSTTLKVSATFDLDFVVYCHSLSPIASHLNIACATQHPSVRLADLRSGSTTHSLVGHSGPVLSVAWSPKSEYVLASGGNDGHVRVWDIRRSNPSLGVLDMEDALGIADHGSQTRNGRQHNWGKAHNGPVNGLTWTEDGRHLVSTSHDEQARVWDMSVGANTLVNFGPILRNTDLARVSPLIAPRILTPTDGDVLFYPNEGRDILMCQLFEGQLLKRLKIENTGIASSSSQAGGQRNLRHRVKDLAWRAHHIELLSAHADGTIKSWQPRTTLDAAVEEDELLEAQAVEESESRKRKRQTLDDIYREITNPRVTFI